MNGQEEETRSRTLEQCHEIVEHHIRAISTMALAVPALAEELPGLVLLKTLTEVVRLAALEFWQTEILTIGLPKEWGDPEIRDALELLPAILLACRASFEDPGGCPLGADRLIGSRASFCAQSALVVVRMLQAWSDRVAAGHAEPVPA